MQIRIGNHIYDFTKNGHPEFPCKHAAVWDFACFLNFLKCNVPPHCEVYVIYSNIIWQVSHNTLISPTLTIQQLWRRRSQNQIVDVPNKSFINDPTIQLPGMDLPRGQWSLLNRFRSDAGPCRNSMHERASPLCDCGGQHNMRHIVNECPLTCVDGGISEIYLAKDAAFNWLHWDKTWDHEKQSTTTTTREPTSKAAVPTRLGDVLPGW